MVLIWLKSLTALWSKVSHLSRICCHQLLWLLVLFFFLISVVICLFSGAKHRAGYLASLLWWPLDAIICNNSKTEPPAYCLVGNYLLTCIWFLVVFCPFWSLCSHWVKFSHMCLGSESVCEKSVINYTSGGAKKKDIFPPLIW